MEDYEELFGMEYFPIVSANEFKEEESINLDKELTEPIVNNSPINLSPWKKWNFFLRFRERG